ncbi:MAG: GNAT family N-acetyltransferase [Candidatus Sumerlaeia bacterium]|nr:GNAT family N-acetyltransferase [Candidatus Sumerlaeia bacterium]
MSLRHQLSNGLTVLSTNASHAGQLEELQELVFPNLSEAERFRAAHYCKHIELFPEGQFVVVDGDRVVGMTTTLLLPFDPSHPDHTFEEVIEGGWLTSHDPAAKWMYGADVGTHPEYRRRGIARSLYAARHDTVRRLGLRGQVTVGMLNGYGAVADRMTIDQYFEEVRAGERVDPTISAQLRVGFELGPLVKNYLSDPTCGNAGAMIVLPAEKDVPFE